MPLAQAVKGMQGRERGRLVVVVVRGPRLGGPTDRPTDQPLCPHQHGPLFHPLCPQPGRAFDPESPQAASTRTPETKTSGKKNVKARALFCIFIFFYSQNHPPPRCLFSLLFVLFFFPFKNSWRICAGWKAAALGCVPAGNKCIKVFFSLAPQSNTVIRQNKLC